MHVSDRAFREKRGLRTARTMTTRGRLREVADV
jgi:hypothetical protein